MCVFIGQFADRAPRPRGASGIKSQHQKAARRRKAGRTRGAGRACGLNHLKPIASRAAPGEGDTGGAGRQVSPSLVPSTLTRAGMRQARAASGCAPPRAGVRAGPAAENGGPELRPRVETGLKQSACRRVWGGLGWVFRRAAARRRAARRVRPLTHRGGAAGGPTSTLTPPARPARQPGRQLS